MIEEIRFGLPPLPDDKSIIVVSDLHLGGKEDAETAWRFCRFLEHLRAGPSPVPCRCHDPEASSAGDAPPTKQLFSPEKIILLGDIVDLWDPRDSDRNRGFLDAMLPFLRMREMDCDVVYVAGNHDEDIAELIGSWDMERSERGSAADQGHAGRENAPRSPVGGPGCSPSAFAVLPSYDGDGRRRPESLKIAWGGARSLEVCDRHYPAHRVEGGQGGVLAGDTRYAFVHGQQFDREQVTHSIGQVLGRRFDPVDFVQDLACISAAKQLHSVPLQLGLIALAAVLGTIAVTPSLAPLATVVGALASLLLALVGLAGVYTFGFSAKGRELPSARAMAAISGVGFAAFLLVLVAGWTRYPGWLGLVFDLTVLASLYVLAVVTLPVLFAGTKRWIYTAWSSSRTMTSEYVLKNQFDERAYRYRTDVLVFGHTHQADYERVEGSDKVRFLVNTGSWVRDGAHPESAGHDTFAYIDTTGICCLRWNDAAGRIECHCPNKEGVPSGTPLCEYAREKSEP